MELFLLLELSPEQAGHHFEQFVLYDNHIDRLGKGTFRLERRVVVLQLFQRHDLSNLEFVPGGGGTHQFVLDLTDDMFRFDASHVADNQKDVEGLGGQGIRGVGENNVIILMSARRGLECRDVEEKTGRGVEK